MSGDDLEAVVKFVHKKDSIKGWSSYNTKAKRVAFLASLVPVWTERDRRVNFSAMTAAERGAHMAALTAAMAAPDE